MRTDTGSFGFHRDAELPEVRRGPDAGAEQDSWRPVGPPREDDQPPAHLAPVGEAHAYRAAALNADALDERIREEGEVRALTGRGKVGEGRVHPHTTRDVPRGGTDARALDGVAIEVSDVRETERFGRGRDRPGHRAQVSLGQAEDWDRAVGAVERAAEGIGLRPLEVGKQVGK